VSKQNKILSIDPGTRTTGYAIVSLSDNSLKLLHYGIVKQNASQPLEKKISKLYHEMCRIIEEYQPDQSCIETLFYGNNVRSILSLGEARGVLILALTEHNIPVYSYSPREVKLAVTGNGNASKNQVRYMVQQILNLQNPPESFDISDAMAIAICHYHKSRSACALQTDRKDTRCTTL
jgi:crossover junction endodeoxyribonuclease RuvC